MASSIVKTVPDGYHTVTPYLSIKGAKEALAFYARAFGAQVVYQLDMPGGKIGHAEIKIGDSRIMLADEMPHMADAVTKSPTTLRATTVGLCLYVDDVDQRFKLAVEAGAIVKRPVANQFYGDRNGTLQDPYGHVWTLATHIENVSTEEMRKRMESLPKG